MDFGTAKSTKVTYQSQFENSKAAMMYMGSWYMGTLLTNIDDGKTNVEWGIAEIPQQEKAKQLPLAHRQVLQLIKTVKQKAAQKFLDFASGKEGAKLLAEVGWFLLIKQMKLIKSTLQEKECLQTKSHKKPLTQIQLI